MKNEIMIFEGNKVEVIEVNGQVLFNPYDVAECLGLTNVRESIKNFNSNQVIRLKNSDVSSTDIRKLNNAGENFLTESGVYKLVFKSRKPDAEKFTDWIADEVLPSIRKTGTYTTKEKITDEVKLMNAKARMANMFFKLSKVNTLSKEYKNILVSKATEVLSGEKLIPLPETKRITYSAAEIGKILGVSANKIGLLANKHNLKTEYYGEYYHDKSKYSSKEVDTFRYYDTAIDEFKNLIETNPAWRGKKKLSKEEFRNLWLKERMSVNEFENSKRILP